MTTPTMNLNAGPIIAGGQVGNVNSHNTIYSRDPGESRVDLANWVSNLNFSQYQSQAYERYTEGTLLWVLEEPEYTTWLRDGGMLWCHGQPGAGKTVFASFIVNHLQMNPNATVCYIYHRYDVARNPLQLFEAILRQLILQCPSTDIERTQTAKSRDQRLTLKEILSILQGTCDHVPNIFLVIDALDECFEEATRHQVLSHLHSLTSMKTLITSRPLPSIEGDMGSARRLLISAHGEDIEKHFQAETEINPRLKWLVPQVSNRVIKDKLVEKADGRFLLAAFHISSLAAQTNVNQLLSALESLPQEVTASYENTLDRIRRQDPNQRQLAFHTLSWILHALRPLTMIELRHALAIGSRNDMAREHDLDAEEFIISSCAGLVIANRRSQRVTFLHYTVQEFLWEARTAPDFLSDVEIALRCIKVVSFPSTTSNYPLIDYAASAWGPLVQRYEQDRLVFELTLSQLADPVTVGVLSDIKIDYKLVSHSGYYRGQCGATAMHLIAVYGLARILKAFLARTSAPINEKDIRGCTALIWAARNGHLGVVKELLSRSDVDVNSKDKYGQTPLSFAARNGNLEVVKELLSCPNVDVNSKDISGRTPLSFAAENGNSEVIKELLSCPNVDVNSKDVSGRTPLSFAAENGNSEVIKELLSHPNVDVDSKDKSGRTPLSFAASKGNLEVVKELLSCSNVDVDSKDKSGRTPLSYAASNRNLEVVKKLLSCPNVNVNSKDEYGQTPLSCATKKGNLEVVKELLSCSNVDVDSKDKYGQTPLSIAALNRNLEVVKELLSHPNVNVNSKDKSGRTPLSIAALNGNLEVIKELLSHPNVDVNSKDESGQTPLSFAAENGNLEVVKELLSCPNVNVHSKDKSGRTPLSCATKKGNLEVVKELLSCPNVDVNSKDISGRTPLFWAALNGNLEVVKKLLSCPNVDVNSKDKYGQTPLSVAAENGNLEVVKELLSHPNVDVNSKDQYSQTPLFFAAENGNLEVVKELLSHPNVNVNSKDEYGHTPLSFAAENGKLEVVRFLAETLHTDINLKDTYWGLTPLLWAANNGHWAVIDFLLNTGQIKLPGKRKFLSAPSAQLQDSILVNGQNEVRSDELNNPQAKTDISGDSVGFDDLDSDSPKLQTSLAGPAAIPIEHEATLRWLPNPYQKWMLKPGSRPFDYTLNSVAIGVANLGIWNPVQVSDRPSNFIAKP